MLISSHLNCIQGHACLKSSLYSHERCSNVTWILSMLYSGCKYLHASNLSGHVPLPCQGEWDVVLKGCDRGCEKLSQKSKNTYVPSIKKYNEVSPFLITWRPGFKVIWMCKPNSADCQTVSQKLKLQLVQFQPGAHLYLDGHHSTGCNNPAVQLSLSSSWGRAP